MKKIIDTVWEKLLKLENVESMVLATFDGLPMKSSGVSEEETGIAAAFLSKYRENILELAEKTAGSDFQIGYYLTDKGFMAITTLGNEAVFQVVVKGRNNTGAVLRELQKLRDSYINSD
jgi:predicted regulator of Ras-like GTPase activity (Roadblock/LC7/MglB family)